MAHKVYTLHDLESRLQDHHVASPDNVEKNAAVLLLLVDKPDIEIVFTQRSDFVQNHKNEVSFPGGAYEREDKYLYHTALRETCEEIHICSDRIQYLGTLNPIETHYGLFINPFVASIHRPVMERARPNDEVKAIFTIPLFWLMNKNNWEYRNYQTNSGLARKVIFYQPYQGFTVWGITAQILRDFINIIEA